MLTYDAETTLVLLHDASHALLVDVSLCIDADVLMSASSTKGRKDPNVEHRWALERKSYVWVVGYLERVDVSETGFRYAQSISLDMPRLFPDDHSRSCRYPCFPPTYHHQISIPHWSCVLSLSRQ